MNFFFGALFIGITMWHDGGFGVTRGWSLGVVTNGGLLLRWPEKRGCLSGICGE